MELSRRVDLSVQRDPIPASARDLATVCVLCSHNCGVRVDVDGGEITAVRADESNPITQGYICNKGFSIPAYVRHRQRVEYPMRKRADGTFERIDWDTAIREIAAKLRQLRADHGPRSIGLVGIGGQANHMDAPYGLGFLRGLGSRRWFNAFAQEKTQHALVDQWMFDASPAAYLHADQGHAKYLMVLGTNPKISNRGHNATEFFQKMAVDGERKLVVVDPRETETTRGAHRHLRVRPGGDAYLLLGMAAALVQHDLCDQAFLTAHANGFDELGAALRAVDIADMAERSGITADEIVATARELASEGPAAILYDLGVEQTPFSTLNSYLIRVLLALTGNLGRRGGNVFFGTLQPAMIDPTRLSEPERALVSGIPAIRALGNAGMFSPTLVPEEVLNDHPERLRAVIVEGANPLLSYSDTARWREACERLELLVVIEPAMTETAWLADYVLPAPVGYEKWEFAAFPKGFPEIFVQLRPPVVAGPTEALPEPEIYVRLAEALELFGPVPEELVALAPAALTAEGAMAYLGAAQAAASGSEQRMLFWSYRALGPHLAAPSLVSMWLISHINVFVRGEAVVRTLGAEWANASPFEIAAEMFRRIVTHPEGVEVARLKEEGHLEEHINHPDKRIRLLPPEMLGEIERAQRTSPERDPAYPLVLSAGLRTRWTANTIQRDPSWRKGRGPHCALNLSPSDAGRLGIGDGDRVRVSTNRGALEMPARIDNKLPDGFVWMPNGFGMTYPDRPAEQAIDGANQNELTDANDRDPFTGVPHHRYVPCRVEPAS